MKWQSVMLSVNWPVNKQKQHSFNIWNWVLSRKSLIKIQFNSFIINLERCNSKRLQCSIIALWSLAKITKKKTNNRKIKTEFTSRTDFQRLVRVFCSTIRNSKTVFDFKIVSTTYLFVCICICVLFSAWFWWNDVNVAGL